MDGGSREGVAHHCHYPPCKIEVHPRYLMCPRHWRMVPRPLQLRVWKTYNHGQEEGLAPVTRQYLDAADAAIEAVRERCTRQRDLFEETQ